MTTLSLEAVRAALAPINEGGISLGDDRYVQDFTLRPDNIVGFALRLPKITDPRRDPLINAAKTVIRDRFPEVKDVWVKVLEDPALAPPPNPAELPGTGKVRHIVAVSSGKGGVGKTTVSVNLAVALADMGSKVGILDTDIYGPNVPLMFGLEDYRFTPDNFVEENGVTAIEPAFNYGVKIVSRTFTQYGNQPLPWRGPMLHGIIRQFLSAQIRWGALDYLIVDLPPGTGDAQMTLIQSIALAGAVIVTTPQAVALLDAQKGLQMFLNMGVPVLGAIENMSYFVPPDLPDRRYDIFGSGGGQKTQETLGVPVLGCIPLEMALREGGDRGVPLVLANPHSPAAQALRATAQAVREALP